LIIHADRGQCNLGDRIREQSQQIYFQEEIANNMSRQTNFPTDSNKMYYYVREPFAGEHQNEGFAKEMRMTSELMDGQVCIDG
jgi:predicted solute-binding protein